MYRWTPPFNKLEQKSISTHCQNHRACFVFWRGQAVDATYWRFFSFSAVVKTVQRAVWKTGPVRSEWCATNAPMRLKCLSNKWCFSRVFTRRRAVMVRGNIGNRKTRRCELSQLVLKTTGLHADKGWEQKKSTCWILVCWESAVGSLLCFGTNRTKGKLMWRMRGRDFYHTNYRTMTQHTSVALNTSQTCTKQNSDLF